MIKNCIWITTLKLLTTVIPVGVYAQGIYIGSGAQVVANGNVNILLNNASFITDGTFKQGTSTIIFTGNATAVQPMLGGSTLTTFRHININRPSNNILLNNDIIIEGNLTMTSGNLQLNNHTLDLAGIITGESDQSHITGVTGGQLRKSVNYNSPNGDNPGNMGLWITSPANLGQTVITRTHTQQQLPNGGLGIQRSFSITPANNTGINATLRIYYFNSELAGANESALTLWSREDAGSAWLPQV